MFNQQAFCTKSFYFLLRLNKTAISRPLISLTKIQNNIILIINLLAQQSQSTQ